MNRREALVRALYAGTAAGWVGLAGCSTDRADGGDGDGGDGEDGDDGGNGGSTPGDGATPTASTDGGSATATATDGDAPTSMATATDGGLDLQEANVTGVAVEQESGRHFRFGVTLYHDDAGEDGYANWWQVETRDGERLGRRELLHAHGTREFTRSETVEVPEGVDCVVVRGHDETHSYGGQAALVRVSTGEVRFVAQGSEEVSMADEDCP
jgi:hypothetical protein